MHFQNGKKFLTLSQAKNYLKCIKVCGIWNFQIFPIFIKLFGNSNFQKPNCKNCTASFKTSIKNFKVQYLTNFFISNLSYSVNFLQFSNYFLINFHKKRVMPPQPRLSLWVD